jgi:hypothetical protein
MKQLARDNAIGKTTGYDYLHEGIDVLAARAPGLHKALLAEGVVVQVDEQLRVGVTAAIWWAMWTARSCRPRPCRR